MIIIMEKVWPFAHRQLILYKTQVPSITITRRFSGIEVASSAYIVGSLEQQIWQQVWSFAHRQLILYETQVSSITVLWVRWHQICVERIEHNPTVMAIYVITLMFFSSSTYELRPCNHCTLETEMAYRKRCVEKSAKKIIGKFTCLETSFTKNNNRF